VTGAELRADFQRYVGKKIRITGNVNRMFNEGAQLMSGQVPLALETEPKAFRAALQDCVSDDCPPVTVEAVPSGQLTNNLKLPLLTNVRLLEEEATPDGLKFIRGGDLFIDWDKHIGKLVKVWAAIYSVSETYALGRIGSISLNLRDIERELHRFLLHNCDHLSVKPQCRMALTGVPMQKTKQDFSSISRMTRVRPAPLPTSIGLNR
jgi:hypothetical protein